VENDFYEATCKLSPAAPEQRYGIAGELLQHCCSNTPGLLEKVYGLLSTVQKNAHSRAKQPYRTEKCPQTMQNTRIFGGENTSAGK
jgi:hypothetical protein